MTGSLPPDDPRDALIVALSAQVEGLSAQQTDAEFDSMLDASIESIYEASAKSAATA